MTDGAPRVRLRQAVLVAAELEPVADQLREALGLGEPFRDPGVAMFGLENAVFAIGDCFLEIVSPTEPGTAAGRHLERQGGDCGYMVMFDLEDLVGARQRAKDSGVRTVWEIDLPHISGTHLHPADIGGAIVSIDQSVPYGTWRWGGPGWIGDAGRGAPGWLDGSYSCGGRPGSHGSALVACARGATRPRRTVGGDVVLALAGAELRFQPVSDRGADGLIEILVADAPSLPDTGAVVGGVRLKVAERRPA